MPGWEQAAKALDGVAMPDGGDTLWALFLALHAARPSGGMGPGAIPYGEIATFQRLHGLRLQPWEVRTIKGMDQAYLDFVHWSSSTNEAEKAKIAERYATPEEDEAPRLDVATLPGEPPHPTLPALPNTPSDPADAESSIVPP